MSRRLVVALWAVPGLVVGALLAVLHPSDVAPRPLDPADVEAQVWSAAIQHVSRGAARVEVVDTTLRAMGITRGGEEVERLAALAARDGSGATPAFLRAHLSAPLRRRDLGEALRMVGKYRMVRVGTAVDWQVLHGEPYRSRFAPALLVGVGRVTVLADGREALVETATVCPGLCGEGHLLLLRRAGDRWRVVGSAHLWSA